MLVLTRKHQEKIRIGDDIVITILRTKGKAVRLGIEAPSTVPVVRGELAVESRKGEHEIDAEVMELDKSPAPLTGSQRNRIPAARLTSNWATESPADSSRKKQASDAQVSLQRIPRGKLADMLPQLASGAGPLRAMLEQRTTT